MHALDDGLKLAEDEKEHSFESIAKKLNENNYASNYSQNSRFDDQTESKGTINETRAELQNQIKQLAVTMRK